MKMYLENCSKWLLLGLWACLQALSPVEAQSDCLCKERDLVERRLQACDTTWDIGRTQHKLAQWQMNTSNPACRVAYEAAAVTWYAIEGQYDTAQVILDRAKASLDASQCPAWARLPLFQMQSTIYGFQLRPDSAMKYATRWLEVAEAIGDQEQVVQAATRVASCYSESGDPMEAMPYARRAYKGIAALKTPYRQVRCQARLSKFYLFAFDYKKESKALLDTATALSESTLALARSNGLRGLLSGCYNDLASIRIVHNRYDEAMALLDSAEAAVIPGYNDVDLARTNIYRSDLYMNLGQYTKAVEILENGLAALPAHNPSLKRIYYRSIYRKAKLGKDLPKALSALETWKRMEDSLFTAEKARALREFDAKYERSKQDNQIRELSQAQELRDLRIRTLSGTIIAAVAVAVAVILGLFLAYRQRLQRSRQALSEAEARLNRARINPHAFFNMLTTLQSMALDPETAPQVPAFLARYARLMRITLETTYVEMIPLEMELQYLDDYLALQALRLPGKFKHSISVDPKVQDVDWMVPSLLLQPLAENAIEHGFQQMANGGELRIRIMPSGSGIVAVVEDNGSDTAGNAAHPGFPSRSAQILDDRMALLNVKRRGKSKFALTRQRLSTGYKVEILIPQGA